MAALNNIISLIEAHKGTISLPWKLKNAVELFTDLLFDVLFDSKTDVSNGLGALEGHFEQLAILACWETHAPCKKVWDSYVKELPHILESLQADANYILEEDPASRTLEEIYLSYPGFYAVVIYRLAHPLYQMNFPLVPRLMTEFAHTKTGVDIHPGAQIGIPFFMDHATGIVIGETTQIGSHVKLYQGVTLGALSVRKDMLATKRHPTIEDHVTIYANATILGGQTVIGSHSTLGGNTWVTSSVPANSMVFHQPEIKIKKNE